MNTSLCESDATMINSAIVDAELVIVCSSAGCDGLAAEVD
jgi:hypothetical protein